MFFVSMTTAVKTTIMICIATCCKQNSIVPFEKFKVGFSSCGFIDRNRLVIGGQISVLKK